MPAVRPPRRSQRRPRGRRWRARLVIAIVCVLLGGDPGDLARQRLAARRRTRHAARTAPLSPSARPGPTPTSARTARSSATSTASRRTGRAPIQGYDHAETVLFTDGVVTGCGNATSAIRPLLLPGRPACLPRPRPSSRSSRTGSARRMRPFARAYVLAHEYGHHVQDLVGDLKAGGNDSGATGRSVRTELQADCYAGVWAHNAQATGFLQPLTADQIAERGARRRQPLATTTSSSRAEAESTRRASPTARRSSECAGSRRATTRAQPTDCDTLTPRNL